MVRQAGRVNRRLHDGRKRHLRRVPGTAQADPAGLANGIKILSTEPPPSILTPQQQLKDLLLGSSEYFMTQAGQSNQTFVTTMFKDATGVAPSAAQISSLLGELNSGMDRGTVAAQVLRSVAGYDFVVQNYYPQILNRAPDSGGLAFFVTSLQKRARRRHSASAARFGRILLVVVGRCA